MSSFRLALASVAVWCSVYPAYSAAAAQTPKFPLVFYPPDSLAKLGLVHTGTAKKRFEIGCYYFTEGGAVSISVSSEVLSYHRQQGFSRRSLCMGLISGIRFDPQTGHRLATYIVVYDLKALRKDPEELGNVSPELPLPLPPCFARALPYSDCAWNYDPQTGKKLSGAGTQTFKAYGRKLEDLIRTANGRAMARDNPCERDKLSTAEQVRTLCRYGYLWRDLQGGGDELSESQYNTLNATHAQYYDFSDELPAGFGYALIYYDTGLGSSVSPEITKAGLDRANHPPQIDPAKLKELWGYGVQ
jgi:hypothetical protein